MDFIKNKKLLLIALLIILIITLFYIFSNEKIKKSKPIEEENNLIGLTKNEVQSSVYYSDIVLENIHLKDDNAIYSIKNGDIFQNGMILDYQKDNKKIDRIIRLTLFLQWMKEDPLFYSSTIDIESVSGSIERLRKEENKLLEKFKTNKKILHLSFLEKIVENSKIFEDLSRVTSEEDAEYFLNQIKKTNVLYIDNANDLKENLKSKISDVNGNVFKEKYIYSDGDGYRFTDFDIISKDLNILYENSERLKEEIRRREKCLLESWRFCERPSEKFLKPQKQIQASEDTINVLSTKDLNLDLSLEYSGPYQIKSNCWGESEEQYLYFSKRCLKYSNYCISSFNLATNSYYYELPKNESYYSYKYLINKGVVVAPRNVALTYSCGDIEYQPKIATISYFDLRFKNKLIYRKIEEQNKSKNISKEFKEIIKNGKVAESLFFDAKYPSEESLLYLADYYAFTYSYLTRNNLGKIEDVENFLNRYLVIKENLSDFDLTLNEMDHHLRTMTFNKEYVNAIPNEKYVYFIRNGYPLLFLNFSFSVWKSEEKLKYFSIYDDTKKITKGNEIMDREKALTEYSNEDLLNWSNIFYANRDEAYNFKQNYDNNK